MTTDSILSWCQTHTVVAAGLGLVGAATLVLITWLVRRLRHTDPADLITAVIALAATAYAGTGTWKYLGDAMHYGTDLKVFLVAVLEGAQIAEALRARKNIAATGSAGVDGAGLWVLTGISAALSTSVAGNVREALGRLVIPLVGAWLWERALAPQRRTAKAKRAAGPVRWRITPERVFVWLRLADAVDTDVARVEAARQITRFLRRSDRERDGWRWPLTPAARTARSRMGLFADALRGGDPTELHARLTQSAYADALTRLGLTQGQTQSALPSGESAVVLVTPADPTFAQTVASLSPVTHRALTPRRATAAASVPARKAAAVTARIGTDRDSVERTWRDSVAAGMPLSTYQLAQVTGVSQSTARRVISAARTADSIAKEVA